MHILCNLWQERAKVRAGRFKSAQLHEISACFGTDGEKHVERECVDSELVERRIATNDFALWDTCGAGCG